MFKTVSFTVDRVDSSGTSHKTMDLGSKALEQINTEIQALEMLGGVEGVVRLRGLVIDDPFNS